MEKAFRKIRQRYSNLKLKDKISIVMIVLLILLCSVICIAELFMFSYLYRQEALMSSAEWLEVSAEAFNQEWSMIYDSILRTVTDRSFSNNIAKEDNSYISLLVDMQPYIEKAKSSAQSISDIYILFNDGSVIRSYDSIPADPASVLFDYDTLKSVNGMALLPETSSPFKHGGTVIPVIIPIERLGSERYLSIDNDGNPDFIIIYLLNSSRIQSIISNTKSAFFQSSNGLRFLSVPIFRDKSVESAISLSTETVVPNLSVTMDILIPSFMPQLLPILIISIICLLAISAIGILSIRRISVFLTNPLSMIMHMIDSMKSGAYDYGTKPKFQDETGKLIEELNDMYATIWRQTERIKEEERQKYTYLAAMLTEQINPHFLYNTLETINMEIASGKREEASLMITDLAQFLRTMLNHGESAILLSNEIMNVEAYVRIMNKRMKRKIKLRISMDKDLESFSVPKSILQPLVENSIKHGFGDISPENGIAEPEISIVIEKKDKLFSISISDNGSGIDSDKVMKAIENGSRTPHVGLKNVYERLKLHFCSVSVSITSYPYFENTIKFMIQMPSSPKDHGMNEAGQL